MLGIIIGVSAVIIMVAIMRGFAVRTENQIRKLGSDLIFVAYAPDAQERRKPGMRFDGLKMDDVRAIRKNCDLIDRMSPEMPMGDTARAQYSGVDTDVRPSGVLPEYEPLKNVRIAHGRFISDQDVESWGTVCVIGDKVRLELFKNEDPLGKRIQVFGQSLKVVGVLTHKGRTFEGDADKVVYIPLSTVQKRIIGSEIVGVINCQTKDSKLISVTERTREIGVRKAVGAKSRDILAQFVVEAATLSGLGGLTGAAVGAGGAYLIGFITTFVPSMVDARTGERGMTIVLPPIVIVGSVLFSACIGLFFGVYPAIRASRLDPIQALRHE